MVGDKIHDDPKDPAYKRRMQAALYFPGGRPPVPAEACPVKGQVYQAGSNRANQAPRAPLPASCGMAGSRAPRRWRSPPPGHRPVVALPGDGRLP